MNTDHLSTRYEGGLKCVSKLTSSFPCLCVSEITIWKVSRLKQKAKYGSTF